MNDNANPIVVHCKRRWASLKVELDQWKPIWREVSDHLLPRRGTFLTAKNKGGEKNGLINNSVGPLALRAFRSGLMSSATSPARPWFKLGSDSSEVADLGPVRLWLEEVRKRKLAVLAGSNIYNCFHQAYEEIGAFGTLAIVLEPDFEDVIRGTTLTIGEYAIAEDHRGQVDTLYREFPMSVGKMVKRWGKEACSDTVRNAFETKKLEQEFTIVHAIEPNPDFIDGAAGPKGKAWRSIYFDPADVTNRVLSHKGYRRFPVLVGRWDLNSGETYGRSVAMEALPDLRQLRSMERKLAVALDKMVNPPMQGPTDLQGQVVSGLPGSVTFTADTSTGRGLRPIYEVNPQVQGFMAKMEQVVARIQDTFYASLFLMMASLEGIQPRNEMEIAERKEEKMLQLGPAYERLQTDVFSRLIDMLYDVMDDAGLIPEPPQELQGQHVGVEYISVLAQAQKSVGITGIERFASFIGRMASVKPDVLDKWDADDSVDEYADIMGVSARSIVSSDKVQAIRAARLEQAQRQQAAQQAQIAASGAKILSETDVGGGANALQRMTGAA